MSQIEVVTDLYIFQELEPELFSFKYLFGAGARAFQLQIFCWCWSRSFLASNIFLVLEPELFSFNYFWVLELELFSFKYFFGAEARAFQAHFELLGSNLFVYSGLKLNVFWSQGSLNKLLPCKSKLFNLEMSPTLSVLFSGKV